MPEWSGGSGDELIKGSECPKCGDEVEYNGNYWCSRKSCSWVCGNVKGDLGVIKIEDQEAFELAYLLLMKQRGRIDRINWDLFVRESKVSA